MDSRPEIHRQDSGCQVPASLPFLDATKPHTFVKPVKKINEGHDVPHFLMSRAYHDIGIFIMQLNISMCPRRIPGSDQVQTWPLNSNITLSEPVQGLHNLVRSLDAIIDEVPPTTTGPRRFGNSSFREWYNILESRVRTLLETHLPQAVYELDTSGEVSVLDELTPYLMGSFGSPERLDYGTGHELSFLAFLGCIWKVGGFSREPAQDSALDRSIVIGIIEPYVRFIRRLIMTYSLEPAGSHGVWGLDDHFFLSYIFGSAQYCPAIQDGQAMPREGFLPGTPHPGDIVKKPMVERERNVNMYFSAVGFIYDVKTGPFWEHSPILFDISGVRAGWGKINKGMIKMFNAEVLSKFPVVQHFPFGSLFRWDQDPDAELPASTAHSSSHPVTEGASTGITVARPSHEPVRPLWGATSSSSAGTAAPWAQPQIPSTPSVPLRAPWSTGDSGQPSTRMTSTTSMPPPPNRPTRAPWATQRGPGS